MKAIPEGVKVAARAQLKKNAVEFVETAKGFVRVDDGDLRASIREEDTSDETRISRTVSAGGRAAPHGWWVEVGTSKMSAYPFFFPAWNLKKRRFKSRMTRAAKKAIQEAIRK